MAVVPKDRRPPVGVMRLVESSIDNYVEFTKSRLIIPPDCRHHPKHLVEAARTLGIPVEEDTEYKQALEAYLPRRNLLVALCH